MHNDVYVFICCVVEEIGQNKNSYLYELFHFWRSFFFEFYTFK